MREISVTSSSGGYRLAFDGQELPFNVDHLQLQAIPDHPPVLTLSIPLLSLVKLRLESPELEMQTAGDLDTLGITEDQLLLLKKAWESEFGSENPDQVNEKISQTLSSLVPTDDQQKMSSLIDSFISSVCEATLKDVKAE